jgi:hypothetical protein
MLWKANIVRSAMTKRNGTIQIFRYFYSPKHIPLVEQDDSRSKASGLYSEAIDSYLGWDTGYPNWNVSQFHSLRLEKCQYRSQLGHGRFFKILFKFFNPSSLSDMFLGSVPLGATLLHQYFLPPFSSPLLPLSTFSHLRWEWVLVRRQ